VSESFYIISLSHPPETVEKRGVEYRNPTLKIGCYKLIRGNSVYVVKLYINDLTEGNKFYGIHGMC